MFFPFSVKRKRENVSIEYSICVVELIVSYITDVMSLKIVQLLSAFCLYYITAWGSSIFTALPLIVWNKNIRSKSYIVYPAKKGSRNRSWCTYYWNSFGNNRYYFYPVSLPCPYDDDASQWTELREPSFADATCKIQYKNHTRESPQKVDLVESLHFWKDLIWVLPSRGE